MSIFLTLLELYSSGLKSILFYSEYQKLFLSGFLSSKEHIGKGRFFGKNHGLTPLQNVNFLEFLRTFFLWPKKHSFLSRISKNVSSCLSLLKKKIWKTGQFFDKNHGLTPFQNVDFFDFFWTSLFTSKKHSFLSRRSKKFLSRFVCSKKTYKKKVEFLPKTMY